MKRKFLSLALGVLPVGVAGFAVHAHLVEEGRALLEARAAKSAPKPVSSTPRATKLEKASSLIGRWKAAVEESDRGIEFLDGLSAEEALGLADEIEALSPENKQREHWRKLVFDRLAEADPAAALDYAEEHWPPAERHPLIECTLRRWARDDPDECDRWLAEYERALPEEMRAHRDWKALRETIFEARSGQPPTERELEKTWRLLESTGPAVSANEGVMFGKDSEPLGSVHPLISAARDAGQWEETVERVVQRPEEFQVRFSVLWPLMQQWLRDDFEAATDWVEGLPPGDQRDEIIWAMAWDPNSGCPLQFHDWPRLLEWELELQPEKYSRTFNSWMDIDPAGASRWLAAQHGNDAPHLDEMRKRLAQNLARDDTIAALAWARAITAPQRRLIAFRKVGLYWSRVEPWAAAAWAKEELGWTDEEVAKWWDL